MNYLAYGKDLIIQILNFKNESGANHFVLSPQKWIENTNAIGLQSKSGRYGGTYAHIGIALEFASWVTLPQNLKQLSKFSYIANPKKPSSFSDSILYFLDTHPLVFYISMFHGIFGDYKTQYNHLHPWLTH